MLGLLCINFEKAGLDNYVFILTKMVGLRFGRFLQQTHLVILDLSSNGDVTKKTADSQADVDNG
jgi:hypothetical protein